LRLLKQSGDAKRMARNHCILMILQFLYSLFFNEIAILGAIAGLSRAHRQQASISYIGASLSCICLIKHLQSQQRHLHIAFSMRSNHAASGKRLQHQKSNSKWNMNS
jgi:hypothetical protein